jgi:NAD(P)-dependent dehydrogenase (short-subunit alcohol dehydrogenase family)
MLAQAGSHLVLAARREEPLRALVEKSASLGAASGLGIPTDVTDYAQVEALVNQTVQKHGRIDVLINLAGAGILKPAPQLTPADLERMLAVNLKGSFYTSQLAANPMRGAKIRPHPQFSRRPWTLSPWRWPLLTVRPSLGWSGLASAWPMS